MTRREQAIVAFAGLAVLVGAVAVFYEAHLNKQKLLVEPATGDAPGEALAELPGNTPDAAQEGEAELAAEVVVHVAGAVREPGVYTLPAGDRVYQLFDAAGGLAADADTGRINLAAPLMDGSSITVPSESSEGLVPPVYQAESQGRGVFPAARPLPPPAVQSGTSAAVPARGPLVNLNQASKTELESLPGIGPVMAQRIVEARPFHQVEQLMDVKGIGEKRFAVLRGMVTLR